MQNSKSQAGANVQQSNEADVTTSAPITPNPMLAAGLTKKAKCHNCKFATKQFKVFDKNYVHCQNEELYPTQDFVNGKLTAWDTLMIWYHTCKNHEFKN